jgi:hypothetical protein
MPLTDAVSLLYAVPVYLCLLAVAWWLGTLGHPPVRRSAAYQTAHERRPRNFR